MARSVSTSRLRRGCAALCAAAILACAAAAPVGAADVGALEQKVADAEAQAGALAADLDAKQAQLVAAQQQAAVAAAREARLSALLAVGEERAAELAERVAAAESRLVREKQRLRRARRALAKRLVAIYTSGMPDPTSVILGSDNFEDLVTRSDYLHMVEDSDSRLAARVEQVRDAVRVRLRITAELKRRADAYNARVAAARSQIASVRAAAESTAADLAAIAASRQATIATLQSNIGVWIGDIQAARRAAAEAAEEAAAAEAATEAAAQEEVGSWLGGPYSIPGYIVMCESGGNYSAVNPSSGAGGAYQIIPSTWDLYGGEGTPHEASKQEQDEIASQIWADSGPGAWVCAG
jgi:septal ring factor EnvC (AmiA/AmiB activator)